MYNVKYLWTGKGDMLWSDPYDWSVLFVHSHIASWHIPFVDSVDLPKIWYTSTEGPGIAASPRVIGYAGFEDMIVQGSRQRLRKLSSYLNAVEWWSWDTVFYWFVKQWKARLCRKGKAPNTQKWTGHLDAYSRIGGVYASLRVTPASG